ncbi:MAG TPA: hypothetical protein VG452_12185 [Egibacteraceae bacterium]|nr:hypothetical protein [Egibacteraceae bacterium]
MNGPRCGDTRSRPGRLGAADGGVALLTMVGGLVVSAVALVAVVAATDLSVAAARARTAADAAALAAAGQSPLAAGVDDPAGAAARVALANGAHLEAVTLGAWPVRVEVTVSVSPAAPLVRSLAPRARARAAAALRPP